MVPEGLTNVVAIAAGEYHSLALRNDGTIVAWGQNAHAQTSVPPTLTNVVAIAAASAHNIALLHNGMVATFGDGWGGCDGCDTNVPLGLASVMAVAAGTAFNVALKSDGSVVAWGASNFLQTNVPTGLGNVVAIAAGNYHTLALKADCTVAAWAFGYWGETHVPAGLTNVVAIAANSVHSVALTVIGVPIFVDGKPALINSVTAVGSAEVRLANPYGSGTLMYTLDGSDPAVSGLLYSGPFTVGRSGTVRAVAFDESFSQSLQSHPVGLVILPRLMATTDGGGTATVDLPAGVLAPNYAAVATATPAPGWVFLQWLGDAKGTNPVVSLSMTRSKTMRAVFGTALTTWMVGGGSIVVDPVSTWHPYGSQVQLTAVPAVGNYFAFWANAAAGQTNHALRFTVANANPSVTAVFASLGGAQTNALTVIPSGGGQVVLTPPGNRFPRNSTVTVQAVPDAGQEFYGWSGAAGGSQNPLTVTMNSNQVITAIFTRHVWLRGESNPELLRDEGFRLTVTGEFGGFYGVLGTAEGGWLPLGTVATPWGVGQFTDPAGTTNGHRFYRTVFEAR